MAFQVATSVHMLMRDGGRRRRGELDFELGLTWDDGVAFVVDWALQVYGG